jgi:hypothetical protein
MSNAPKGCKQTPLDPGLRRGDGCGGDAYEDGAHENDEYEGGVLMRDLGVRLRFNPKREEIAPYLRRSFE